MENENTKKIEELAEKIIASNIDENPSKEELAKVEIPEETIEEVKEQLTAPTDTRAVEEEKVEEEKEKMLPQSQVNELMAKARREGRESAMKEILHRYNVESEDDFNAVYDKGTKYDSLNEQYLGQNQSYKDAIADNALLRSNFDTSKYDSVKAILRGKGLDITPENIDAIFPDYPEWHKKTQISPSQVEKVAMLTQHTHTQPQAQERTPQPTTLRKLGNETNTNVEEEDSEYNRAMRLYGFSRKGGK